MVYIMINLGDINVSMNLFFLLQKRKSYLLQANTITKKEKTDIRLSLEALTNHLETKDIKLLSKTKISLSKAEMTMAYYMAL